MAEIQIQLQGRHLKLLEKSTQNTVERVTISVNGDWGEVKHVVKSQTSDFLYILSYQML